MATAYKPELVQLEEAIDRPSADVALLRDLTEHSKAHDGAVGFCASVVRIGPRKGGEATLMSRQSTGWSAFGYTYPSLFELATEWRLEFQSVGRDDHSVFIRVTPIPKGRS